jgi:Arc/MetJ-type ribon-helix-helix transcriptional regulator
LSYITFMTNEKADYGKQITVRLPREEYERLMKLLGPYGSLAPLIRDLVRQYLQKANKKANAA